MNHYDNRVWKCFVNIFFLNYLLLCLIYTVLFYIKKLYTESFLIVYYTKASFTKKITYSHHINTYKHSVLNPYD